MNPLQFLVPLGWLDVVGPILPFAIFALAVANLLTRHLAHKKHVRQASEGDSVDQYAPHAVTDVGIVLLAMLFSLTAPTGGTLLALVAITLLVADLFELEARNVEARNDMTIERPKSAMFASVLVVGYALYYVLVAAGATFWGGLFA